MTEPVRIFAPLIDEPIVDLADDEGFSNRRLGLWFQDIQTAIDGLQTQIDELYQLIGDDLGN